VREQEFPGTQIAFYVSQIRHKAYAALDPQFCLPTNTDQPVGEMRKSLMPSPRSGVITFGKLGPTRITCPRIGVAVRSYWERQNAIG